MRPAVTAAAAFTVLLVAAPLAGCSGTTSARDPDVLTVWNLDAQPDRIAAFREIDRRFTDATGVTVEQVGVDESQLPSLIVSAAVSGTMPDLIAGLPLNVAQQLGDQDLLDTAAAADVVGRLGPGTFSPTALEFTAAVDPAGNGGGPLVVPSETWAQILVYRTDVFADAGLAPPTTFDALRTAADELTGDGRFGVGLPSDPADPFTAQTFEGLALANGCDLVDGSGTVRLDSPQCRETFELYGDLARDSPAGTQTLDTTRAGYFAGQTAMTFWSTFLLDELAGLRDDALPTCSECRDDPQWLAQNTGVVTELQGPSGAEPVSFGEVISWGITGSHGPAAADYVEFMMSDGYTDALGIAPEGKYPARAGDATDPTRFADAWAGLPAGVDTRRPLAEVYGPGTVEQVAAVSTSLRRWGIPQAQGPLLGPVNAELPVPQALSGIANGSLTPDEAAREATDAVQEIERSMS